LNVIFMVLSNNPENAADNISPGSRKNLSMDKDKHTYTEAAAKPAEKKHDGSQALAGEGSPEKKHGAPSENAQDEIEQAFSGLTERLLRLTAEFDNYKKRTAREKDELCRASEARLMIRLLPAYEEAGLAQKEVEKITDTATRNGVLLVLGNLRTSFEKEGLQPMKLENEKLDPFRHEVALREDSDAPEGTIVRVIKQGYFYKGEVLRHAIVSVSSGNKTETEKPEEKGE
jgi:molecular chaperone GrpE